MFVLSIAWRDNMGRVRLKPMLFRDNIFRNYMRKRERCTGDDAFKLTEPDDGQNK